VEAACVSLAVCVDQQGQRWEGYTYTVNLQIFASLIFAKEAIRKNKTSENFFLVIT
jgi:hypothetical protein